MAEKPLLESGVAGRISLAEETRYVPDGTASRTLLRTPGLRLVLFGFAAGQELTEHTSPHHALVQGLTGECEFRVGDQVHRLGPGDLLSMPPHAPHSLRAVTDFSMLLTLAPTPMPVPGLPAGVKPEKPATGG